MWPELAVVATGFALGNILFGHFEAGTPKWRRILKFVLVAAATMGLSTALGRPWAFGILGSLLVIPLVIHLWWLPKQGINGWTGEPKEKYYALRGWKLPPGAILALLAAALGSVAAGPAAERTEAGVLTQLLQEFLAGASRNDAAAHERFWAEELIYTSSSGKRMGKADILRDLKEAAAAPAKPDDGETVYTAEEIRIQEHGETAVVAFRLVGTTRKGAETTVARYLNTGTFVKRDGRWQAVAWQATRIPADDDGGK